MRSNSSQKAAPKDSSPQFTQILPQLKTQKIALSQADPDTNWSELMKD